MMGKEVVRGMKGYILWKLFEIELQALIEKHFIDNCKIVNNGGLWTEILQFMESNINRKRYQLITNEMS